MTVRDDMTPPPCPGCGEPGRETRGQSKRHARFECMSCVSLYDGTQAEWDRWALHRARREGSG